MLFFSSSVSQYVKVFSNETSQYMKRTSVDINTRIKQLCNHKVQILLRLSGCETLSGPSRNGSKGRVVQSHIKLTQDTRQRILYFLSK